MIERTFEADYEVDLLEEIPVTATARLFFPGASSAGGTDGLNLRVAPHGADEWIGTFARGFNGASAISGVFTTPDPKRLCVVVQGEAYLVNVLNPADHQTLRFIPVTAVRSSIKHQLLIFANYTELLALGPAGVAWCTDRLSWDGLTLTTMTDDALHGVYRDMPSGSEQTLVVDLATGAHTGGAVT